MWCLLFLTGTCITKDVEEQLIAVMTDLSLIKYEKTEEKTDYMEGLE